MHLDPRNDALSTRDYPRRAIAIATVFLNAVLLGLTTIVFAYATRSAWHIAFDFLAAYTVVSALIIITWRFLLRQFLVKDITRAGSRLDSFDLAMSFTALLVLPLVVLFMANSVFRFL